MGASSSIMCKNVSCMDSNPEYSIENVKKNFLIVNDEKTFRRYIDHAIKHNHMKHIKNYLADKGYIRTECDCINSKTKTVLTTGENPFNVFARYANYEMKNPVDQIILKGYMKNWMVCHNRPENDMKWNDVNNKAVSMCGPDEKGPGHVFITTKDIDWKNFNILTIVLSKNVEFLLELKEVAMHYVKQRGWKKAGMYFHCFPHNSVNSLHLHIVNEEEEYLGHMYRELQYKNLPLDVAIKVAQSL